MFGLMVLSVYLYGSENVISMEMDNWFDDLFFILKWFVWKYHEWWFWNRRWDWSFDMKMDYSISFGSMDDEIVMIMDDMISCNWYIMNPIYSEWL